MHDYEHTLHYVICKKWDELFMIMVRTKDDFLERKIHHFLYAYHYTSDRRNILATHHNLLDYINHALYQQYKDDPINRFTDALLHSNNQWE